MTLNELDTYVSFDKKQTLERFSNYEVMVIKYLKKFVTDPTFDAFKEAVANKNKEDLENTAHSLKGICGNLGLTELFDLYNAIVKDVREDKLEDALAKCDGAISKTKACHEILMQLEN